MKEYTVAAAASVILTVFLDRILNTRVLVRKEFWFFLGVMFGFEILANGYLTWRPIVLYAEPFFLGIRFLTIPVEDFLYGFTLVTLPVVLWEYFKGRQRQPGIQEGKIPG